jgi:tetratricopeptide (TPR) repeat protein
MFTLSFVALLIVFITGCAHRSYFEPYDRGVALASQGNYKVAKQEFMNSLDVYQYFTPSIRSIEIIDDMNKGIISRDTAALIFAAVSNSDKKLYDQAIIGYNRAIDNSPEYAYLYVLRGSVYSKNGEHDMAINDYNTTITIDPGIAETYINRGITYADKNQYESAIQDYQKAIELDPNLDLAYLNSGVVYEVQKLYDSAVKNYTSAIEINPVNAEAYTKRANLHHILGKYDLAIKDYNNAIEFNPDVAVLYSNRGYVHLVRLGHEIKGCLDLQRACKLGECEYYDAAVQRDDC